MATRNRWIAMLVVCACVAACAPAIDWREFVAEGSELHVAFPCRPDRQTRVVVVAGSSTQMSMLTCRAGEVTYAIGFLGVADPQLIGAALSELRTNALNHVHGRPVDTAPAQIPGMTANAQALRLTVAGRLPDGAAVQEHAVFFSHGLKVYQAAVIGAQPGPDEIRIFFEALKFPG